MATSDATYAPYCSKGCQIAHWKVHKCDCKSPLIKCSWKPEWMQEHRPPTFINDWIPQSFGTKKYLWGNMPGIDVLKLGDNEGVAYPKDLKILFAASGDFRNIVKTVSSLPQSYTKKLSITVNDIDFDIVARNVLMLLLALTISDEQEAAETVLHFWYSALIRPVDMERLWSLIPLIEDVCTKIAGCKARSLQAKTFTFGLCSLRVILKKEDWTGLLKRFSVPRGLCAQQAQVVRKEVTNSPQRSDYRHRDMMLLQPEHRLCKERFREDGILVPYSFSRDDFTIPNPTFYQAMEWPMLDEAEPHSGWDFEEVLATKAGNATNDLYGKLFVHVRSALLSFKHRLSITGAKFELYNMNATELPQTLAPTTFARVETSNICDQYCLGPTPTVRLLAPLLQKPSDNPHATLVTLFMNAVEEVGGRDKGSMDAASKALMRYKTMRDMRQADPLNSMWTMMAAMPLVKDNEKIFARYAEAHDFSDLVSTASMKVKTKHTVVPKWPTKLKLKPDQPGAEEEFTVALASSSTHSERYVEWVRTT